MDLRQKITSLTSSNTVMELNGLLGCAEVRISWWGQRLVSIKGYEGSVEINELASKYFQSAPFHTQVTPQERLLCAKLWNKVEQLYVESDSQLAATSLYKHLIPLKESLAAILEGDIEVSQESLFAFTPTEFHHLWPQTEPQDKTWVKKGDGTFSETWFASQEMMELLPHVFV